MSTYDFLGLSGGPFATAYALRVFTCIVTSARNGSYSKHALFHCVLIFLLLIYNIISHILIIAGNEGFFFYIGPRSRVEDTFIVYVKVIRGETSFYSPQFVNSFVGQLKKISQPWCRSVGFVYIKYLWKSASVTLLPWQRYALCECF